jgi:hypothetical protein
MFQKPIRLCAGLCLYVVGALGIPAATAQENTAKVSPPPKVLVVDIEFLKPGKGGSAHQKTESAFIQANEKAKSPDHYLALEALSGPPRELFFFSYDSLAEFEKVRQREMSNTELSADIDRAYAEDGDLLSSMERNILTLRDDLIPESGVAIATMRYMQITRITIRPGHQQEWEEYLKLFWNAEKKTDPDRHVAVYQSAYGWQNGGVWVVMSPMKSLDEVDKMNANNAKFRENMGSDLKHYGELAASIIESSQRNLYAFDPSMSYVSDDWVETDPSFWKRK